MSLSVTDKMMVYMKATYGGSLSIDDYMQKFWATKNAGKPLYGKALMDFMLADAPACTGNTIADRSYSYWTIKSGV